MSTFVTEKRIVFRFADSALSFPSAPVWIKVPILFDDNRTLESWCERYCPIDTWHPFVPTAHDARQFTDGRLTGTYEYGLRQPAMGGVEPPRWTPRPRLQLNQLYWPNGASRHAIGHFIIAAQDATRLFDAITDAEFPDGGVTNTELFNAYPSWLSVEDVTTEFDDDGNFVDETIDTYHAYWYVFPIAFRPIGSSGEMYAMTLVDDRWMIRHVFAGQDNQQGSNYLIRALVQNGTSYVWDKLTDIAGVDFDVDLLDNDLGTGRPASSAFMVDALADSHLKRWVYSPYGGVAVEAHDPSLALTRLAENDVANLDLISGGELPSLFTYPKSLMFDCCGKRGEDPTQWSSFNGVEDQRVFRVLVQDSGTTFSSPGNSIGDYGTSYTIVDGGRYGWRVESSFDAYGISYDVEYRSTAVAIAEAMFARMRQWTAKQYDYTFSGLVKWKMTGFDDYVIWSFGTQYWERNADSQQDTDGIDYQQEIEDDYQSLWTTRVVSYPIDHFPRRVSQRSPSESRLHRNAEWLVGHVSQDQRDPPDGVGPQGPNGGIVVLVNAQLNGENVEDADLASGFIEVFPDQPFSGNHHFRDGTRWIIKWDYGRGYYRFWSTHFDSTHWRDSLGNPLQPAP